MLTIPRRKILKQLLAGWGGWELCVAHAEDWPTKPVKIVVPFPPGGYADVYARLLAEHMEVAWGQPVTVHNRPGNGGVVGAGAVAQAVGDHQTLLMGTVGTHAINASLFARLPYHPVTDFSAISLVVQAEGVLVVPAASPARTVQELIGLARTHNNFSFASAGPGTTSHLAGELFRHKNRLNLIHVPYKGNSPALIDLIGGQTSMMFATLQTVMPHLQSGRLRALAVLGALSTTPPPLVRGLPSLAKSPWMGKALENWAGLFGPAGMSAAVVQKIHAQVQRILQLPVVQARMHAEGMHFVPMSSHEFSQFVLQEILAWRETVQASGAVIEG
ncbi:MULTISPECIES: Bug family tripartite tricarboxylate transporter substrate binding protein [Giesbergeria]|uniref:Bug family tripartite tricarboxylate transporter substrate binding protein n=1 Tax=Giesbergeria sinuosa TaxID=80883 RepID=A0ABV9QF19_9BURK